MFWLIFRIIIYIIFFVGIWFGGQFYIAQEFLTHLQQPPTDMVFVNKHIADNHYYEDLYNSTFDTITINLIKKYTPLSLSIENGSAIYPFTAITDAFTYAQDNGIHRIIIASGLYDEKIIVPDNFFLYGDGTVLITQSPFSGENVVQTGNNSTLFNINISGGDNTVVVPYNTSATLRNLTVSHGEDFGILMGNKEREKAPEGYPDPIVYEFLKLTEEEIAQTPLLHLNNVTVSHAQTQGLYLRDGRVLIENSHVIYNGEEGIDLHPHMIVTVRNTESSHNGESGLETEVYDNIVTIENSIFDNNVKNGIAFLTSLGTGEITVANNRIVNNLQYGIRCAVHKDTPTSPRPFFQTVITQTDNYFENNVMKYASECFSF